MPIGVPSAWAAGVTVLCYGLAGILRLLVPARTARVRRAVWICGGVALTLTLVLFALEGIPTSGSRP